ncbi:MAG: PilN domain-containing protein [Pseudomonadota bacterium]|nr:PilN domain-containing protein [Pseudomonadota bacterium]
MLDINLLPWREELRREQDRRRLITSVLFWVLCALLVYASYSYLQKQQEKQRARNDYLQGEIATLNKKIAEIKGLRNKRDNLLARMEVIQNLQRDRTRIVHLFEDIVRKLPEGIHFTELNKKDNHFIMDGVAQSNARVSDLMNRLDDSEWFANPDLDVINVTAGEGGRLSRFKLRVAEERGSGVELDEN